VDHWQVSDVMTPDVVTVSADAPVGEIVDKMVTYRVSGLAIVDDRGRPVGVVSQADLLPRVAATRPAGRRAARVRKAAKATATSVRGLMSTPALTIGGDEPLSAAARKMQLKKVKRLLVTDDAGQLVGIVSRADLLRLYARTDAAIRGDVIKHVLRRILWIDTRQVQVDVHAGVVTLSGSVGRRTTAAIAARLTGDVPGVVAVVDEIRYGYDDDSSLARSRVHRTDPLSSEPRRLHFSRGPTR
jgi:CBS domain-containing protein